MSSDKVKVAVRVRPFNRREIELNTKCVVEMDGQQTLLHCPNPEKSDSHKQSKNFAFDHSFWSVAEDDPTYADQANVYHQIGVNILDNAFSGYNACIFAYGQTGSGKSYTMMGSHESKGIIPRLCDTLFERIATNKDDYLSYKVEVSYMEIYNEKVHDLLDPKGTKRSLRVREHNILGPYVDDLSILAVSSYVDVDNIMQEGNKSRTVAATNMNSESSRSHAVFNVILTQTLVDPKSGISGEKVAKLSMVDLAGSERAVKSGAMGERLKEGSNINKSLTTLGLVISKLADQSSNKAKDKFIPYRDSVLTWLLKDNLGGNSRTVMVATISPASDNYEETLSTLRYADRAKRIVNHAVINEDPNARIIRELRLEVETLKEQLKCAVQRDDIHEKLLESEKLMEELSQTWEEKLHRTELIHQERQHTLEKMGISVQASGIKVEQNKYYLVNLNADPSLNELLVYYLKDVTLIGRPDATVENDIQLSGLGIMPEHCVIRIEGQELNIIPHEGARTCVNGIVVVEKTALKNGDRVLWGNNHFFRVNCPKSNTGSSNCSIDTLSRPIDYEFAREELMMNELSNDPIQMAMKALEKQHEEDKQGALDKQRLMYEKQLQMLRNQMSPGTPYAPYVGTDPFGIGKVMPPTPTVQMQVEQWTEERDGLFKKSLTKLREDIVKANALVREAKSLAIEMGKPTDFGVTLQIPAANLTPNRKKSAFVSEPAILVKRKGKPSQVWSLEKLENKLIDMRDMYNDYKDREGSLSDGSPQKICDTFYESQENHNLIGVANVYLEVLFHDVKLVYHVPIISQQGEVAGRLHIEISRTAGFISDSYQDCDSDCSFTSSKESTSDFHDESFQHGSQMTCRVCIKKASGLPPSLSNFVFCQYNFWNHPEVIVVPPAFNPETSDKLKTNNRVTFRFDHSKEFVVNVTEEFIEYCSEGALSIEVWGHQSVGFCSARSGWELETQFLRSRSLSDRWIELTRKIELWVEIHELNDQGEYSAVEVLSKPDCLTGGVFQLRQGQQRRIVIKVKPVHNSGTLPLICESITSVALGGIVARNKLQKGLDSYQEEDLTLLREKWSDALMRRREYLDEQIQKIIHKEDKSDEDVDRERSLIDHWVCLTEERNAVLVPAPNSGIPGEPAEWNPPIGMEKHVPVLFLNLNADDMSFTTAGDRVTVAGINSILPKEHGTKLFNLPIVKYCEKDVCASAAWDSSIHESVNLNRITSADERVYLILKATVRLSHPAIMELILRKRLSVNIYKRQTLTDRIKKRIGRQEPLTSSAVTYEIVSNIPKALEELEDREYLAQLAASGEDSNAADGESYIEKYTRGVSAVESILTLDRLRQEVAVKELLTARGRLLRKTVSVPNISHFVRSDGPPGPLEEQFRAESIGDISCTNMDQYCRQRSNSLTGNKAQNKETTSANHFPLAQVSQPTKLVKPMRTLLEEQYQREAKPLLANSQNFYNEEADDEDISEAMESSQVSKCEDFSAFESYKDSQEDKELLIELGNSENSLHEDNLPTVKSTPQSVTSSGYNSQAIFSHTSSEDFSCIPYMSTEDNVEILSRDSQEVEIIENTDCRPRTESGESSINSDTRVVEEETVKPSDLEPKSISNENVENAHLDHSSSDVIFSIGSNSSEELHNMSVLDSKTISSNNEVVVAQTEEDESFSEATAVDVLESSTLDETENESCDSEAVSSEIANVSAGNLSIPTDKEIDDDSSQNSFGSYTDLLSECQGLPGWVKMNEHVLVLPNKISGSISFIGCTQFAPGLWVGIDLDSPSGKNDGSVQNVRYFSCRPRHGIFVRPEKLILNKRSRTSNHGRTIAESNSTSQEVLDCETNNSGKLRRQSQKNALSKSSIDLRNHHLKNRSEGLSTLTKTKYRRSASHMK